MTTGAALTNVLAWSAQVAMVTIACAPLPRLLRVPAHVQYGFWRVVLLACLGLPWLEPSRTIFVVAPETVFGQAVTLERVIAVQQSAAAGIAWPSLLITALVAGTACRLAWTTIGWLRLRGIQTMGNPVADDVASEAGELMSAIGASADIRWIEGLRQPSTFGLRRPVVLLPDALRGQPAAIRRAVIAHELFHVQRRDSATLLIEELIRAATWFHPAMWWLISRVRLAREGVVDELTVMLTGARQTYLDALLLLADEAPLASSAFSRRHQLFYRVQLISREVRMTSRRFVAASAILAFALVATGWTAASAFPLQKAEPTPTVQNPPTPPPSAPPRDIYRNPEPPPPPRLQTEPWTSADAASAVPLGGKIKPPKRLVDVRPVYPEEARINRVRGIVIVKALIDREGNVEEVHVLRSIPLFDQAAVDAVSQWKFEPTLVNGEPVPLIMTMTINFNGQ
ncbi:MAG TPA: M56 family metallopeptidase [Vicinamibacterales bacterium]|jgi:TonB family protein